MSTVEALIEELRTAPEPVVRETYDFLLAAKQSQEAPPLSAPPEEHLKWVRRRLAERQAAARSRPPLPASIIPLPDFAKRQREIFGDKVLPDSMPLLDAMREDRF